MKRLLPIVAALLVWGLLSLVLGSCAPPRHTATAPRRWVRQYHHQQRKQERQRRRLRKPNITWSKL